MRRFYLGLALVVLVASVQLRHAVGALPCRSERLLNTNGMFIRLHSGQVFRAFPGSEHLLGFWLPLDRLTVCDLGGSEVRMTDLSQKNQVVQALRVYP